MSLLAPIIVVAAFGFAVGSIWATKPGERLWAFKDTGYDPRRPPSPAEWRSTQVRYAVLALFLGALFTAVALATTSAV